MTLPPDTHPPTPPTPPTPLARVSDTSTDRRLAAIDVGSNSIRLIVVEYDHNGAYKVIDDEKILTRLGSGLNDTGALDPDSIDRSVETVLRFKKIAEGYSVNHLRAVATSAIREASNSKEFIGRLRDEVRIELVVIDGDEEARLAFRSVADAFDISAIDSAVADIGGGSTEIVLSTRGVITEVVSIPIGAVRLTERFGAMGPGNGAGFYEMRQYVKGIIRGAIDKPDTVPAVVFGTGGTFTNMAAVAMHRAGAAASGKLDIDIPSLRGYEITRSDVLHILATLRKLPVEKRASVPGLSPERADIIVAGIVIVDRVMKHLGANRLRVHDRGIRDGIVLDMLEEIGARPTAQHRQRVSRPSAARQFAVACRYEEHHGDHVARLALQLFDQVIELTGSQELPWASGDSRELLEAAALLHDIGYLVNYTKHHKHAYHLIVHSEMPAFTHRELEIVANVARYHRRACPKNKHKPFKRLASEDRECVRMLSAFLRIADGLDRTHAQRVHAIRVIRDKECVRIVVHAEEEPAVDIWGGERKADLFHEVFHFCPRFEWSQSVNLEQTPLLPRVGASDAPIKPIGTSQAETQ